MNNEPFVKTTTVAELGRVSFELPWDSHDAPDPVAALTAARAKHGDTFTLQSGETQYVMIFSAAALEAFYELPERVASKGLADYRMLLRKLPEVLFNGRRTFAHDLFGATEVTGYLPNVDHAIALGITELQRDITGVTGITGIGDEGLGGNAGDAVVDVFGFARRLGHRIGITSWFGKDAPFEELVALLDQLDGADAFVHPEAMIGREPGMELAAMAEVANIVQQLLDNPDRTPSFFDVVAQRWHDTHGEARATGIAYDLILLHIATMTNLFAAIGWALSCAARYPNDAGDLDRLALEAIRLGQRSIITREVLCPTTLFDGVQVIELKAGMMLATMAPVTNRAISAGARADGNTFDPSRWAGPALRNDVTVATFGHGEHRCPAQRFSMLAITRTVSAVLRAFEISAEFDGIEPLPLQVGGIARPAHECLIRYRPRTT